MAASVQEFFVYTASFGSIAANGNGTVQINIESDSQFVVQKLAYFVTDAAGTTQTNDSRILPNLTIQITDTGSGRNLQNEALPVTSICGEGDLPHILSTPKTFKANSIITTVLTNFGSDNLDNVFINFIGKKVFAIAQAGMM